MPVIRQPSLFIKLLSLKTEGVMWCDARHARSMRDHLAGLAHCLVRGVPDNISLVVSQNLWSSDLIAMVVKHLRIRDRLVDALQRVALGCVAMVFAAHRRGHARYRFA